jgi:YidC/Oxa1 family membrane protein insertase
VTLPLIGNSFNLLPILLVVAMYLQSKFNPAMGGQTATMTAEQQQQQKMMKIMMPLMMLLFFYNAPSGLTLYIMSSTTIGLIEQHVIRKHIREQEELEKQTETVVDAGGRGPRGNRPKKPKNPFRMK